MARLGEVCTFFAGTGFPNQYQGNANGESRLTIRQSLDKLEVLKKSLMQEYFGK